MNKKKINNLLVLLLAVELLLIHVSVVYAQTSAVSNGTSYDYRNSGVQAQITQYLCTPSTGNPSSGSYYPSGTVAGNNDLFTCINKLYRFAIAAGSVISIFFIVIAGYLYMASDGNQETVDKAKNIFVSSITAMVILMGGYVLLKALNPDLLKFQSIQPPNIVLPAVTTGTGGTGTTGSTGGTTGTSTQHYSINGFDIGPYATDPNHEIKVQQIYNSLQSINFADPNAITQYMQRVAPSTQLTGAMVLSAAQSYNADPKLIVALMQQDSSFGTAGKGARTHNPGNVGNDDLGNIVDWGTWQAGVNAVASWLSNHRG